MRGPLPKSRPGRFAAPMVAAVLALTFGTAAAAEIDWDTPDKKWRSGPVKYLLTDDEIREFKKLKTDEARAQFVTGFWERRDPTPGTPENEYRESFYKNARDAAAQFSEDGGKGWQDDRGKIYILLGPPNDMSEAAGLFASGSTNRVDNPMRDGSGPAGASGPGSPDGSAPEGNTRTILFIYLTNPLTGAGRLELSFVSDVTGGFRLQEKLDWDDPILRGLASPKAAAAPPATAAAPGSGEAAPEGMAELAPPEPISTPQSELMELVRSETPPDASIPLEVRTDYYMAAEASTAATMTISVPREALPENTDPATLIVSAEMLDTETGESVQRFFQADQFGHYDTDDTPVLFQSQRSLSPGHYTAIFALKEPGSGSIGALTEEIDVPRYEEGTLTLSTVTLAYKLEPVVAADGDAFTPFILGGLRVVPRISNRFTHGEKVLWYYQIYGGTPDPTGDHNFDISYAIEKKQGTRWVMLGGKPIAFPGKKEQVQGYGFDIKPVFPTGDYRVRITVKDTIGEAEASRIIPFTLVGPEKTSEAGKP